jgi:hypothetical protein
MKLTAQRVFEVAPMVGAIIAESRPMPLKGAYRLARLHAKLEPEWRVIAERRDALILAYDHKDVPPDAPEGTPPQPMVPDDKVEEFAANWQQIAAEEIEVAVEPIPLSQLDLGPDKPSPLTALELARLGDLVVDDDEPTAKAA